MPRIGDLAYSGLLKPVGTAKQLVIDFDSKETLQGLFPALGTRGDNLAWAIAGRVTVVKPGSYKFCITSDDGSKLYIDGVLLDNDDRPHGMVLVSCVSGVAGPWCGGPWLHGPGSVSMVWRRTLAPHSVRAMARTLAVGLWSGARPLWRGAGRASMVWRRTTPRGVRRRTSAAMAPPPGRSCVCGVASGCAVCGVRVRVGERVSTRRSVLV